MSQVTQQAIHTIRMLSIDQIEKANSGHPGMPMGAAPMAYTLWANYMKHSPKNPKWWNRDRFVLSAGHGSALLYSLLHLFGYDLSIEDLMQFRQWGSKTPGHPEVTHTPGVEATTGPLGQGISMAVGMAMAERYLAATYNRERFPIIDHFTYVICGDGDLMEGVAAESCSLAGHLKLGKLICLYDSNDISLDGDLERSFSEDVRKRFEAYGWQYLRVEDGNDILSIGKAIEEAQKETSRPSLIEVKTIIGYGSPNRAGTSEAHGKPLGKEEVQLVRQFYGWPTDEEFYVSEEVREHFAKIQEQLLAKEENWKRMWEEYKKAYPELAAQLEQVMKGKLPDGWDADLPKYQQDEKPMATRSASGKTIQVLAKNLPMLIGGSADLASSNNTEIKNGGIFHGENPQGRNIWFGVREHAMGAILNGMMLHGGVKAFGGTFLVFSDYLRPAIRMSALCKLPVVYVFTHDSIAVGEDGPTHQPIEHIPSLRLIPGLKVVRPADANETSAAWAYAVSQTEHPVALILTRQNLPILEGTFNVTKDTIERGAYVVSPAKGEEQGILLATGSEVSLAVKAQAVLAEKGIHVRVVSIPCRENFAKQSKEYQEEILPSHLKARVVVEAAHPMGWEKYAGEKGSIIGIDHFGASAPGSVVMERFGFTVDRVVAEMEKVLNQG